MNNLALLACKMACKDWLHESSLSICGVLALASMLAPLIILHGIHNGVIARLRDNLMRDPAVMVLVPASGTRFGFDDAFIENVRTAPGLRFAIGRARAISSEVQMRSPAGKQAQLAFEATEQGDPLFVDYGVPAPHSSQDKLEIVLTHTAAGKLDVKSGDMVEGRIARRSSTGKLTSLVLHFYVIGVLPAMAGAGNTAFADMATLMAIQDFRDGLDAPLLGMIGEKPAPQKRYYDSFRAYAATLDDVQQIEKWFKDKGITMETRSRDIAAIKKIDSALGSVIGLIALAGCVGFFAFMASTARAQAMRKWKQMGMLKLIGFNNRSISLYPMTQSLLTGALGCGLAFLIYLGLSYAIDFTFSEETAGGVICEIPFSFFCLTFVCVETLAILASLRAAIKASSISPSTVIRES